MNAIKLILVGALSLIICTQANFARSYSFVNAFPGDDLQKHLDGLCAQGDGTLFLNPGVYPITRTLFVSCNDIKFSGSGMNQSELLWAGVDEPIGPCPQSITRLNLGILLSRIGRRSYDIIQ